MTDVWTEASRDVVAEQRAYGLEMAKSAGAGAWSFLALARSQAEFSDRVALASESITRAATKAGISPNDLLQVFAERFALLMEAGENPFAAKDDTGDGDDEDQDDDSDKQGDGKSDDSGEDDSKDDDQDDSNSDVDDAGTDETDDNGTDGGDDSEQDDNGDDNADDDGSGHDKDEDQKDDVDGREASPAFGGIYSSLMQRIQAGEDPLTWGGSPFVASLGRTAVGADMPPVSDTNVPAPADPMGGGMGGTSAPLTTKPRQLPGGNQSLSTPPADPGIDPAANGGDIQAGQGSAGGGDDNPFTAKLSAIAADVRRANPELSPLRCHAVAMEVVSRYLVTAEDVSPLLFGDRGQVEDGPLTHKVKNWQPPSPMGGSKKPGEGSQDDSGPGEGGEGGEGAGGAGEAAEGAAGAGEAAGAAGAAGEVAELAPLLLL